MYRKDLSPFQWLFAVFKKLSFKHKYIKIFKNLPGVNLFLWSDLALITHKPRKDDW